RYTPEAMQQRISGDVELDAVVGVSGEVADVRIAKSLDSIYGLDQAAVTAVRLWRFRPGLDRDGHAVPVIVMLIVSFRTEDFLTNVCRPPSVIVEPRLEEAAEPAYTPDAIQARIQGTVRVEAVVRPDGAVARTRIAKSPDNIPGLDAQAL